MQYIAAGRKYLYQPKLITDNVSDGPLRGIPMVHNNAHWRINALKEPRGRLMPSLKDLDEQCPIFPNETVMAECQIGMFCIFTYLQGTFHFF